MKPLMDKVTSAKGVLKRKRNREGYDSSMPMSMFKTCTLEEFINRGSPYETFLEFSQVLNFPFFITL